MQGVFDSYKCITLPDIICCIQQKIASIVFLLAGRGVAEAEELAEKVVYARIGPEEALVEACRMAARHGYTFEECGVGLRERGYAGTVALPS